MKIFIVMLLLLATGCTSYTRYGECVGIVGDRDPKLVYQVSVWNSILAIVFFELVIPPVVVVATEVVCPVGYRAEPIK